MRNLELFLWSQTNRIQTSLRQVYQRFTPRKPAYQVPWPWARWHGTNHGWVFYGCRCEDCVSAHKHTNTRLREARKAAAQRRRLQRLQAKLEA